MIKAPPAPVWQMWMFAAFLAAFGLFFLKMIWPNIRRAVLMGEWEGRGVVYSRRTQPRMFWLAVWSMCGLCALFIGLSVSLFTTLIVDGWPVSWEPNAPRVRW